MYIKSKTDPNTLVLLIVGNKYDMEATSRAFPDHDVVTIGERMDGRKLYSKVVLFDVGHIMRHSTHSYRDNFHRWVCGIKTRMPVGGEFFEL